CRCHRAEYECRRGEHECRANAIPHRVLSSIPGGGSLMLGYLECPLALPGVVWVVCGSGVVWVVVCVADAPPAFACGGGPVCPVCPGGVAPVSPIALPRVWPIALPCAFFRCSSACLCAAAELPLVWAPLVPVSVFVVPAGSPE